MGWRWAGGGLSGKSGLEVDSREVTQARERRAAHRSDGVMCLIIDLFVRHCGFAFIRDCNLIGKCY